MRNVKVPEGINVSPHRAVSDLLVMSTGLVVGFVLLTVVLLWLGGTVMQHLPRSWERALADMLISTEVSEDAEVAAVESVLQAIGDRLAAASGQEDLRVVMHYDDTPTVNAFATLGGHIYVFRGLIERMPNENALAMVLAHEIGHVINRDAAQRIGGSVLLQAAAALIFTGGAAEMTGILYGPGTLVLNSFSREAERAADVHGVTMLVGAYGHAAEATELFEQVADRMRENGTGELELFSTHPLSDDRIAALHDRIRRNGWPQDGPVAPMPEALRALAEGEDGG